MLIREFMLVRGSPTAALFVPSSSCACLNFVLFFFITRSAYLNLVFEMCIHICTRKPKKKPTCQVNDYSTIICIEEPIKLTKFFLVRDIIGMLTLSRSLSFISAALGIKQVGNSISW